MKTIDERKEKRRKENFLPNNEILRKYFSNLRFAKVGHRQFIFLSDDSIIFPSGFNANQLII